VHDPAPVSVTMLPLTVHCPDAVKLNGKPEEAPPVTGNAASPYVWFGIASKVIVCADSGFTAWVSVED
jgi:hypothetical protein